MMPNIFITDIQTITMEQQTIAKYGVCFNGMMLILTN